MRPAFLLLVVAFATSSCSLFAPRPECHDIPRCGEAVDAALAILPPLPQRIVVGQGRGIGLHLQVHACYGNGDSLLVDVWGGDEGPLEAVIRGDGSHALACD